MTTAERIERTDNRLINELESRSDYVYNNDSLSNRVYTALYGRQPDIIVNNLETIEYGTGEHIYSYYNTGYTYNGLWNVIEFDDVFIGTNIIEDNKR